MKPGQLRTISKKEHKETLDRKCQEYNAYILLGSVEYTQKVEWLYQQLTQKGRKIIATYSYKKTKTGYFTKSSTKGIRKQREEVEVQGTTTKRLL